MRTHRPTSMIVAALATLAATVMVTPPSLVSAAGLANAPQWTAPAGLGPERPATCPALTPGTTMPIAPSDATSSVTGTPVWPVRQSGDPTAFATYLHTAVTATPQVPSNWASDGSDWKLGAERSADTTISSNPQELCGVQGNSVDTAWQTTTGAPTTVIGVLDSGIRWCDPGTVEKIALNRAALPAPEDAQGRTKADLVAAGATPSDTDPYDLLGIGVLDVAQYAADPRVAAVEAAYGGTYCSSEGGDYTGISAEDLIRTFGRPTLPDTSSNPSYYAVTTNGFTEAIAGWNFVDNTNDPIDDVSYGHGTGEAGDMAGSAGSTGNGVGACPSCRVLPVRVGTSFIAASNAFAQGVAFAVDSGATIVSEALGAIDHTASATQAIDYASAHGVPIVASSADEESEHANLPSSMSNQVIDVNSSTRASAGIGPASALLLNGCTNYGPQISVTVESSSCSSEATGKTSGIIGLAETAAAQSMAAGTITAYPGLTNGVGASVPLSANEILQLVTMSADDVDFTTAAPSASPPAKHNNFALTSPTTFNILGITSKRYKSTPGYDLSTGYGRIDAARIVRRIATGQIPPEALVSSPTPGLVVPTTGKLAVTGTAAAVRSSAYTWQLDVAPGASPADSAWKQAAHGAGTAPTTGTLATLDLATVADLFPGGATSLTGANTTASGSPSVDRFAFTIRLVVQAADGQLAMSRSTLSMHDDPTLVTSLTKTLSSSLDAPIRLAPLGPDGSQVAVVPESDGTIHAYTSDGAELPGWPVHTDPLVYHAYEPAFSTGAISAPHGEIIGGVAIGNLADAGGVPTDVVATDYSGKIYAWDSSGTLLPGWPVHSNPDYSASSARDRFNRLLPGFLGAPSLADLTGNGTLDVVASGMDRHVYAFSPAASALPGWPVLVIDPSKVAAVDPVTNHVTFSDPATVAQGTELLDTPAIGSLSGSGRPNVVVASDEEYYEPLNASLDGLMHAILSAAGYLDHTANARVYALSPNGTNAGPGIGAVPSAGAILPGWPAKVGDLEPGLLPTIGDGATASPALVRLGSKRSLTVVTGATAGPLYELTAKGASALGTTNGLPNVLSQSPALTGLANLSIPALGAATVAPIGRSRTPSIFSALASLGRLADQGAPGAQTPSTNLLGGWSASSGAFLTGFPGTMNDLQFLTYPIVANVAGRSAGGFVIQGSGLGDLRAYGPDGVVPAGWPKFTGGWVVGGAAVGQVSGIQSGVVMVGTRSGQLWAWRIHGKGCKAPGAWPQVHHDLANSSNLSTTLPASTC